MAKTIVSLDGKWHVCDTEGEFTFVGNVPGSVQGDLISQNLIPNPYVGLNESNIRKLEEKSWVYTKEFDLDDISDKNIELVFEGIDTIADIFLNEQHIGSTNNMFIEYRFNVKAVLRKGRNVLRVYIKSPLKVPKTLERMYGKLYAVEESSRPYIRKAQYSYGWDWGARIATSGIWKHVYLEYYEKARLTGCTAYLDKICEGNGIVRVSGIVKSPDTIKDLDNYKVEVKVNGESIKEFELESSLGEIKFDGTFELKNIQLWYPVGLGEPHLYDFEFNLKYMGKKIYGQSKKIGLRTVEISREKDNEGEKFIFVINGEKVFIKGANWIPADNILSWLKPEDYEKLIYMAKEANMNMLRIWGGGIYESEEFYSLCDKEGIMIWQDFMFACGEYPDHLEWFRTLCNNEVKEVVRKLRYHPSIVLWCGNNENNWAFDEWFTGHKVNGEYLGNRLYLHDFPLVCANEDPSRPYWPSSPYGGDRANSRKAGDVHEWGVWSGWADYKSYTNQNGRFISEFGFQAAPHPKTIDFFAKKEEQKILHPVMLAHNKQVEGQERILRFINLHFGIVSDFDTFVYLSQVNQAEALKFGVEYWRSRKYKTAGTLYWQLNDSWPVFSWSCIDYFKRPKALYYYTRRFYADILPMVRYNPREELLRFIVVNDFHKDKMGSASLEIWDLQGNKIGEKIYEISLWADSVCIVDEIKIRDLGIENLNNKVVYMTVKQEGKKYENYFLFDDARNMQLEDPELSYSRNNDELIFCCKKPAFGVFINSEDECIPSDNFFFLVPTVTRKIKCASDKITVKSLYDYMKFVEGV